MSEQRITVGYAVKVNNDISEDKAQEINDYFDDNYDYRSGFRLSYENNILIYKVKDKESYNVDLVLFKVGNAEQTFREVLREIPEELGLTVDISTLCVFFDHWYDGCDSNHMEIQPEDLE